MNTPQSPFAPLQELQEEQREGWVPENKTATAMNIETLAGIRFNTSRGLAPFEYVEWKDVNDQLRAANIAGMQAALDAYLTSIGEGMPSVEDCRSVAKDGCEAIRNLLLSAFAKKMEAISRLPEKWRIDSGLTGYCSGMQAVKDLEAALGSLPVEPVPEVPADPYAHLKLAWANKRRIRTRRKGSDGWSEWNQPGDVVFYWNLPPECYEIEPLHADKWAAEKAAHAQGKRIEWSRNGIWHPAATPTWKEGYYYRIAPTQTFHTPAVVQQLHEEAAAINAVMNPAPAGKLSDEQLGEIGAKAARGCIHWSKINTAFAAAVREAVEKEQAEEIARLTAKTAEMVMLNAKQHAELERLRWRSVEVKPTNEDADGDGSVQVLSNKGCASHYRVDVWNLLPSIYVSWRPFCPPPAPTAEEVERERFEKACAQYGLSFTRDEGGNYRDSRTLVLFDVWQLARAKEAQS